MKHWVASMCVLVTAGLASAEELQIASDPATARFERALAAHVDEVLERRVDAAADRAWAVLETRESERMGETVGAVAGQPGSVRGRLLCAGGGTRRGARSC
jgi:hypothetical protein